MIRQPFALVGNHPNIVLTCAWCAAPLKETIMRHRDDCAWIADIRDPAPTAHGSSPAATRR